MVQTLVGLFELCSNSMLVAVTANSGGLRALPDFVSVSTWETIPYLGGLSFELIQGTIKWEAICPESVWYWDDYWVSPPTRCDRARLSPSV